MGASGSGKSTVGGLLAQRLGCSFLDADDLHPARNLAKMARGEPLDDADRWPWLERVGDEIASTIAQSGDRVIACSALAHRYRERLRARGSGQHWVYLRGSKALLTERLVRRQGHFMKPGMLESQLAVLEEPEPDEALIIDVVLGPHEIVSQICRSLRR